MTRNTQISKTLSFILRHGAEKEGIAMRADGFVKVQDLFKAVDLAQLQEIVAADAKTRFTLRQDEHSDWWICANQGHSIQVDWHTPGSSQVAVEMDRIQDAAEIPVVVHGTNLAAWASIKNEGLSKMNRQHIHFAVGKLGEDGVKSGMRHNTAVFIYIDTALAMKDNIEFFRSANNVILSTGIAGTIPPLYFARVEDKMGNSLL
ncbi:hypothetical protein HDU91_000254 [Kappamyces sp. JEL0680]|nr:hypothetical protein HDU91_000254 [Kappamyces sp. JEL0680]